MKVAWFQTLPVTLRVPIVTAALMIALGLVASQGVLAALGRLQDARLRETAQLHVDGLSVALGPAVLRRMCGRSTTSSTARSRPSTGNGCY